MKKENWIAAIVLLLIMGVLYAIAIKGIFEACSEFKWGILTARGKCREVLTDFLPYILGGFAVSLAVGWFGRILFSKWSGKSPMMWAGVMLAIFGGGLTAAPVQAAGNDDYIYCVTQIHGTNERPQYYSGVFLGDYSSLSGEKNDFHDYVKEQIPDGSFIGPITCFFEDTPERTERKMESYIRSIESSSVPLEVVRTGWTPEEEIALRDFNITVPASDQELEICVRDYSCIDGDAIRVTLDGSRIFDGELYGDWDCQKVGTSEGKHPLELYAINDTGGKGGCPNQVNTGEIRITGKTSQSQSWRHGGRRGSSVNVIVEVK